MGWVISVSLIQANSRSATSSFPPSSRTRTEHLGFLDGVRGVACLYVMLHHFLLDLPAKSRLGVLLQDLFSQGHCAVDVFIVLSGYCLALPMLNVAGTIPLWPFIRRRALRILPTYYISMIVCLVLIKTLVGQRTGTNWDASLPVSGRDIALHVLLIHEWSTRAAFHINSPFWSIGVEWKIYFLFPALLALRGRLGATKTAALAVGLGYAAWWLINRLNVLNPSAWGSSPYYVGLFALGIWAADLSLPAHWSKLQSRTALLCFSAWTLATLGVIVLNYVRDWTLAPIQILSGAVGLWAASALALLRAGVFPRARKALSTRPFVFMGKIGYTTYLIHAPLAQFVYQYVYLPSHLNATLSTLLMPLIFVGLTLAIAVPFYRLFERPFHELSRRAGQEDALPLSIGSR